MAGIIAQITRANRKRIENRKFEINSAKCMYEIKPFDPCYDPKKHNKYIRATLGQEEAEEFYQIVHERVNELNKKNKILQSKFSLRTFIWEFIFISTSLAFVPLLMLAIYLIWPVQLLEK